MKKQKEKFYKKMPDSPGIYMMKDAKGRVLYIGKAGNLRRRVSSYFARPHDIKIERLLVQVKKIDYEKTDTAIEALILESKRIREHEPAFNVKEKDGKSFLCVEITNDALPRVLLVRGARIRPQIQSYEVEPRKIGFGPFTSASSIREALRIIRRIFPYSIHPPSKLMTSQVLSSSLRACFDYEIGLCPGTCVGGVDRKEYLKNIRNIRLFFEGKKKKIIKSLTREMEAASRQLDFERAAKLRRQIFSLQHIHDIALIQGDEIENWNLATENSALRIEGYDISNISGTSAVGSMVVFAGEKPDKNEYRKFKIQTFTSSNDVGMLKEVLRRRFARTKDEGQVWPLPDVVLIDGGRGQVNAALAALDEVGLRIPVVGIAKGRARKKNEFVGKIPSGVTGTTLIKVRNEAHRFAIAYHRNLRGRSFLSRARVGNDAT
ncbi:UvrB/UvrC motif-containing protein [Candidatus Wolfebacteria bacterium]|nr:UvrB/UvrC motif-containing protein [Candidatus Wolfebacteria bacterium]